MSDSHKPPLDNTSLRTAIDAHVHLWTQDARRYPIVSPFNVGDMQPHRFTVEDLFRHTRPAGVDRVVLIQMSYYGHDNSFMLDSIAAHPQVFRGVAILDERDETPEKTLRELRSRGVRGVRLTSSKPGDLAWFNRPTIESIWRSAADERIAICLLINPEDLPAVDRMCQRFGNAIVVVDHCARIGGDGQFCETDVAKLCGLAKHRNVHVKLSAFYYLSGKRPPYDDLSPMLWRLCDAFGPGRLMWGSDCPFQVQVPHSYLDSLAMIRDRISSLSSADRAAILFRTAEAVFFGN